MLAVAAASALVAGAVACASTLDGLGEFPCAKDHTCPEGWTCFGTVCRNTAAPGSDAGAAVRKCEYHGDCTEGACIAIVGGGSACTKKCSGLSGSCTGGDCKLVLSGVLGESSLVPACMSAGNVRENALCTSVDVCTYGLTCARGQYDSDYYCTEMCNPFKTSCTNSAKRCTYGMSGYPADWGLCYLK